MNDEGEKDLELIPKMEKDFAKLGLSLYDTNGNLKSTYDIMADLAPKYVEMNTATKAYYTELIAGKFQAQNASAILSNFSTATEATSTALNSAGSAAKENEKYLNSIAGKAANLSSQFQKLATNLIDSGLIKGIVDFGTSLLKFANTDVGQVIIKITALSTSLILLSKVKSKIKFADMAADVKKYVAQLLIANAAEKGMITTSGSMAASFLGLGGSIKALTMAMLTNPIFIGTAAISLLSFISNIDSASEAADKAYTKAADKYKESKNELENVNSELKTTQDRIKELEEKESLTLVEEDELQNLRKTNAELQIKLDLLQKTNEENAKKANKAFVKKYTALEETDTRTGPFTYDITFSTKIDDITKYAKTYELLNKKLEDNGTLSKTELKLYDELKSKLTDYASTLSEEMGTLSGKTKEQAQGLFDTIYKSLDPAKFKQLKLDEILSESTYKDFKKDLSDLGSEGKLTEEGINKMISSYDGLDENLSKNGISIQNLIAQYNKLSDSSSKLDKLYKNKAFKGFKEDLEDLVDSGNLNKESLDSLINSYEWLKESLDSSDISIKDIMEDIVGLTDSYTEKIPSIEDINDNLDSIQSAYDVLSEAMNEYNNQGYISIDTLQSLASAGWDYLQYLFDENGQLKLNEQGFIDMANAQLSYLQVQQAQELLKFTDSLKGEGNQLDKNKIKVDDLTKSLQENNAVKAASIALAMTEGQFTKEEENAITERAKKAAAFIDQIQKTSQKTLTGGLKKTGSYSSKSSGSKSSKSEKEWWKTQLDLLKNQFSNNEITINQYISGLNKLLGKTKKGSDAWKEVNKELQKQRLDKVEDDYKRGTISLTQYINQLKILQKAYKTGTDAWNELADKIKKGLEDILKLQKESYDTAHDAAIKLIDNEIDKINNLKDAQEKYYDDLIAEKEKANNETEREIELAQLQENLANAKNERNKRVFVEGIGWQWTSDQAAIDTAQKELSDFMSEKEIQDLENAKEASLKTFDEQIDAWENYKQGWEDVVDEYDNQQARLTLAETLGADAEAKILQQRLDVLEKFRIEYNQTLAGINALENTSSTSSAVLKGNNFNIKGYANGGTIDYTGYARVHGSPSNPEYIFNSREISNLISSLNRPQASSNLKTNSNVNYVYNFDKLELPNVTNSQQFMASLKAIVNTSKNQ